MSNYDAWSYNLIVNDDVINLNTCSKQHPLVGSNETVHPIGSNATSTLAENMPNLMVAGNGLNGAIAALAYDSVPVRRDQRSSKIRSGPHRDENKLRFDLAAYYIGLERNLLERPDTLKDQELLELIVHIALGNRNAKRLARALIARYRTLGDVISAIPHDLSLVRGLSKKGVVALKLIKAAAVNSLRSEISTSPVLSGWDQLIDYLSVSLMHERVEHFHVLFLNGRGVLLADELQGSGTIDRVTVYPREIIRRCLELDARAIIMVHNHPSGDPTPSEMDIAITKEVKRAAALMGITLNDHVIIGRSGSQSLRQANLF